MTLLSIVEYNGSHYKKKKITTERSCYYIWNRDNIPIIVSIRSNSVVPPIKYIFDSV